MTLRDWVDEKTPARRGQRHTCVGMAARLRRQLDVGRLTSAQCAQVMHTLWAGYADAVTTDDSLSCLIEFITILCRNARMGSVPVTGVGTLFNWY